MIINTKTIDVSAVLKRHHTKHETIFCQQTLQLIIYTYLSPFKTYLLRPDI